MLQFVIRMRFYRMTGRKPFTTIRARSCFLLIWKSVLWKAFRSTLAPPFLGTRHKPLHFGSTIMDSRSFETSFISGQWMGINWYKCQVNSVHKIGRGNRRITYAKYEQKAAASAAWKVSHNNDSLINYRGSFKENNVCSSRTNTVKCYKMTIGPTV